MRITREILVSVTEAVGVDGESLFLCPSLRYNGAKANDGEVGSGKDAP